MTRLLAALFPELATILGACLLLFDLYALAVVSFSLGFGWFLSVLWHQHQRDRREATVATIARALGYREGHDDAIKLLAGLELDETEEEWIEPGERPN